jgi:hypothetical protein
MAEHSPKIHRDPYIKLHEKNALQIPVVRHWFSKQVRGGDTSDEYTNNDMMVAWISEGMSTKFDLYLCAHPELLSVDITTLDFDEILEDIRNYTEA